MVGRLEFSVGSGRELPRKLAEVADEANNESFRVVVLGDFSGRLPVAGALHQLKLPERIDLDSFDTVLARLTSGLQLRLPGPTGNVIEVSMRSMEDFEPDALFLQHPLFARLRKLRSRLADPATFDAAAAEVRLLDFSLSPISPVEDDPATLARLLGSATGGMPPASAQSGTGLPSSLDQLLRSILAPHIRPATSHLQQPLLDTLDRAVSDLMRQVLRHPTWRSVESSWRCVDNFLRAVDAPGVSLEVLDVQAAELTSALADADGHLLYERLVRLLDLGNQGTTHSVRPAVVVGLYQFGSGHDDLALISALAEVCFELGSVLLASAAPDLVAPHLTALQSQSLSGPAKSEEHAGWQGLRALKKARHVALLYPGVLGRLPYGPKNQPVASFVFDELGDGPSHDRLAWRPAALDAAALLAQAHADEGRHFNPDLHRVLGDFPAFVDRSQTEPRLQACAETYWSERQLAAIGGLGIIPLISDARLPRVRLGHWRSIAADGSLLQGCWCT